MAMTDDQNNDARDMWAEALSSLFRAAPRDELFRISDDEIDALEGLSPDRWPTAGQTDINWDLSVPGHRHTIDLPDPRVLQPADCEQIDLSSLVLGKASFADFDPLLHSCFRLTDSGLWVELTNPKLGKAILHIAKGWPVSPVLLSVHEDGGFHFGDGTHRYEVLKRTGTPHFYFLAMPDDVSAINKQLTVQWMSD
ncbi:hypothetical protein U4T44_00570 [Klebsiella pneumoniae]|jgi:hypothetical protein|uniref:hypothetical protein n=1 Tax=Klebsiella pneumoniae TaxID=573 RepID=UPI001D0FEBF4|nr:hypothetical protein [Klebsiella pneumoniae]MCG5595355.1 hypothetical protein [Klebsiella pneumoniae]MCS6668887.1 hypothetical protein [Klebsiella pneumoniae subsp. pneumoniae]MDH8253855.1 hypothetical protein [Klebsiella pneumoniae]MDP0918107.1 hypothetical protein [Klebsiella pneumoniae]MDP0945923.1 hypothetical protein [Klebsiella pneumoniae]